MFDGAPVPDPVGLHRGEPWPRFERVIPAGCLHTLYRSIPRRWC